MRIIKTHLRGAAVLTTLIIKQSFYATHSLVSKSIHKISFRAKRFLHFGVRLIPITVYMKYPVMKLNMELQKCKFISGDKILRKHNPKMKSSDRKNLLMRDAHFYFISAAVKIYVNRNFFMVEQNFISGLK